MNSTFNFSSATALSILFKCVSYDESYISYSMTIQKQPPVTDTVVSLLYRQDLSCVGEEKLFPASWNRLPWYSAASFLWGYMIPIKVQVLFWSSSISITGTSNRYRMGNIPRLYSTAHSSWSFTAKFSCSIPHLTSNLDHWYHTNNPT